MDDFNAGFLQQLLGNNLDPTDLAIYHDYLVDKEQPQLASIVKILNELIGASLKRNLRLLINKDTVSGPSSQITTGLRVAVYWNYQLLQEERIDLH